jgi:ABC-type multidrug transport system fused ATPase/permease subunit
MIAMMPFVHLAGGTADGSPSGDLGFDDLRSTIGVVTQDGHLFHDSVRENLRYADPTAEDADLWDALRKVRLDGLIASLPDGLGTVVGERGYRFSGGERQRLTIARLLLAKPRVVILDEATASLDSTSEAAVQDALAVALEGRTALVIAHRLSTIRDADLVLVLENGRIVERGTHAELLAVHGRYRQLYEKQYCIEMNRFINPGEDWTPEVPRPVAVKPASTQI